MDFKLKNIFSAFLILCISFIFTVDCAASPILAPSLEVKRIRYWPAPDHIRIVLDMSGESIYNVRELTNPCRIVIDIPGGKFPAGLKGIEIDDRTIDRIRINRLRSGAQVVFDLPRKTPFDHFALKPFKNHPHRIVFDLIISFSPEEITKKKKKADRIATSGDKIVIIDPGHGGSDPGACSKSGIKEKDIVLGISRMLAESINRTKGFKAILTREGDYNVDLGKRIEIARSHGGDCFVSIHLNAFHHSRADGSEIYFLSIDGATDKNAQRVAEKENFFFELGNKRGVKQANFVVLRSIAMPSILVEAGFLSNSRDVKFLRKKNIQQEIASSIAGGVISFLESIPFANANNGKTGYIEHVVKKGETLWGIAREYGLPVDRLRSLNNMDKDSSIYPGQKLRIRRRG